MAHGRILDVSALLDFAHHHEYVRARVAVALRSEQAAISLPAAALGEALGQLPQIGRRELQQLISQRGVVVDDLTVQTVPRVGQLLANARQRAPEAELVAAHVAFVARLRLWPVLTRDPGPIHRIDAALDIDSLP